MQRLSTLTVHDLTERELLILRQEVDNRKKSTAATWLLWLFLGGFGGHRFYLGRIGTGIAMLFTLGGLGIWWLVDIFLISGMLRAEEQRVQAEVMQEIAALREMGTTRQGQGLVCPACGSQNVAGAQFCRACGASLLGGSPRQTPGAEQRATCPKCGANIVAGSNPCPNCGTGLSWGVQQK